MHAQVVDGTLKKFSASKTIGIAYRTNAVPFAYEGEGKQPAGYTVELCKRIAASLELVRKGQADMECGSTTVSLSRMGEVDFLATCS